MGRYAVRSIARLGTAGRLLIADINMEYAQRLAKEVGEPCEAYQLDATDEQALHDAFGQSDVVCNTMGPFSIFGGPILKAALESGCHYLDIDDDWQSTVEAFEFHDLAVQNQVKAIIGLGGSPGTSNLLAMVAVEPLDTVTELYTGWALRHAVAEEEEAYPAAAAAAAVEHWLLQCSGTIRIWDDGGPKDVRPVERLVLEFPEFGEQTVYSMGHPEPLTLPRTIRGVRRSLNVQTGPAWLFEHLRNVATKYEAGEVSLAEGALELENPPRPAEPGPRDPLPYEWALAYGDRDGEQIARMVYPVGRPRGRMGGNTGVPLAIGVDLLARGRIKGDGVLSPEAAIDPHEFFAAYAPLVDPPCASESEVLAVHEQSRSL
jgi:saccharopine dehydrogenase-like NADP-dependent oxidoreductase